MADKEKETASERIQLRLTPSQMQQCKDKSFDIFGSENVNGYIKMLITKDK